MKRIRVVAVLMGMGLVAGSVCAENYSFEFGNEVKQGEQRAGFTYAPMIKTATFTVGALSVSEIKPHRHNDGSHALYIVSGGGTMMHGDKTITLKPGMVVYVPVGIVHAVKSDGGGLTLVDFAQPPFDPAKIDWIK
jgi:quercetin dioxygenase-like cupin family protein